MKKVLIGLIAITTLTIIGWIVKVNFFEAGALLSSKYKDPDAAMRLNVQGTDLRVYEFTPQKAPNVHCIFVAGTNKGSLFCLDKRGIVENAQPDPTY